MDGECYLGALWATMGKHVTYFCSQVEGRCGMSCDYICVHAVSLLIIIV